MGMCITLQIKRASKCNSSFFQYVGINDKVKRKFVYDTLNRWLGIILETSDNINVVWKSTSLHDLRTQLVLEVLPMQVNFRF
jgi:hypothetical protein